MDVYGKAKLGASWRRLDGFRGILFELNLKVSSKSGISHLSTPPLSFVPSFSILAVIVLTLGISTQVYLLVDWLRCALPLPPHTPNSIVIRTLYLLLFFLSLLPFLVVSRRWDYFFLPSTADNSVVKHVNPGAFTTIYLALGGNWICFISTSCGKGQLQM